MKEKEKIQKKKFTIPFNNEIYEEMITFVHKNKTAVAVGVFVLSMILITPPYYFLVS